MESRKFLIPLIIVVSLTIVLFFIMPSGNSNVTVHSTVNIAIQQAKSGKYIEAERGFLKVITMLNNDSYYLKLGDFPDLKNPLSLIKNSAEDNIKKFRGLFSEEFQGKLSQVTPEDKNLKKSFIKELTIILKEQKLSEVFNIDQQKLSNEAEKGYLYRDLFTKQTAGEINKKDKVVLNRLILSEISEVFPAPLFIHSIRFNIAMLNVQNKNYENAKLILKEIIKEQPEYIKPFRLLMEIYLKESNYAEAIETIKEGLENNKDNEILLLDLAYLYDKTGKENLAKSYIAKVLEINPDNPYALNDIKIMERKKERKLKPASFYKELLKKMPSDLGLKSNLIIAYIKENKETKAVELLEKTLKDHPDDLYLLKVQGRLLGKNKNLKKASEVLLKVYKKSKETDPEAVMLYGVTLYNQGLTVEAEKVLSDGLNIFPDNHYILLNLAKVRETMPDKQKEALEGYRKYLQLRPKDKNSVKIKKIIKKIEAAEKA